MSNPKSKIPRPDSYQSRGGQNLKSEAELEIVSTSIEETQAFGERFGRALKPGDVVALYGELGSGKTTLIQGLARGLGYDPERIKSPTFVLMREYAGQTPLVHIDGYRLEGAPAVAWLDVEMIFSPSKVTVIEWAERFTGLLPDDRLEVRLSHLSTNRRRIALVPVGSHAEALVTQLQLTSPPTVESKI